MNPAGHEQIPPHLLTIAHELRAMEADELVEIAKQVKVTVDTPGWRHLAGLLERHEAGLLREPILGQAVLAQSQYADIFGKVGGIQIARLLPEAIELLARGAEEELRRAAERRAEEDG